MNESDKFMRLFGGIFFGVGVLLIVIGGILLGATGVWFVAAIPLLMSIIFGGIGGGILIAQFRSASRRRNILRNGQRFSGKIYGYVEDHSGTMNGAYLINTRVRYFDMEGIEREAILSTGFTRGSGEFPIGATIDIIVLDASCTWVPGSIRYDHIYREAELMDNKPLDPQKLTTVAITCRHCGASFTAAKGYANTCPYCGSAINV